MNSITIKVTCSSCGERVSLPILTWATFICQKCGNIYGFLEIEEAPQIRAFRANCSKCKKEFIIGARQKVRLSCPSCLQKTIQILGEGKLSAFIREPSDGISIRKKEEDMELKESILPPDPFIFQEKKVKVVIPYYYGNLLVERAVRTWIGPDTVFALTDEGVIPPGSGTCKQFFTPVSAKSIGVVKKTKPLIVDIIKKMFEMFPEEDFYGIVNSDIMLPPGSNVRHLLPKLGFKVSVHHRLQMIGGEKEPPSKLKRGYQEIWGKDGFFMDHEVTKKMIEEFGNAILGSPGWDDSLAVWCWENFGKDKVDIRWGEIWHPIHETKWTYDEPEGIYNFKVLKRQNRNLYNWEELYNQEQKKEKIKPSGKPKQIGIIQPGRVGDIVLCLPIAKWYFDKGYQVSWPVASEYLSMLEYAPYVKPIDIGGLDYSYEKSLGALRDANIKEIIDLGIGFGKPEGDWIKSGLHFDEWKYFEAKVPFQERYNLNINRNFKKEGELLKRVSEAHKINGRSYTIIHEDGSSFFSNWNIPCKVKIIPMDGFTIFDWISIIENAGAIFFIDSCFSTLINQLDLGVGRRFVRHNNYSGESNPDRRKLLTLNLSKDWGFV